VANSKGGRYKVASSLASPISLFSLYKMRIVTTPSMRRTDGWTDGRTNTHGNNIRRDRRRHAVATSLRRTNSSVRLSVSSLTHSAFAINDVVADTFSSALPLSTFLDPPLPEISTSQLLPRASNMDGSATAGNDRGLASTAKCYEHWNIIS